MIWLALAAVAVAALAPLALSLWRSGPLRGRRNAALDLHRAQLDELDRDLEQGRIALPEHAIARVEVQRRLLGEAEAEEPSLEHPSPTVKGPRPSGRGPLILTLVLVPLAAVMLYLPGSAPHMPAMPLAARRADARAQAAQAETLIAKLNEKIAGLPLQSAEAREGYLLLGNLEDTRGDLAAAARAWQHALDIRFDPTLGAEVAEARSRVEGTVSAQSAALFRRALAEGPTDAPWRAVAEQRLKNPAVSATDAGTPASSGTAVR